MLFRSRPRISARGIGGWLGATLGSAPSLHRRWIGVALLPQAGVAVGMALVAGSQFPDHRDTILTLTIGTTIVFELFGPLLTLTALKAVNASEGVTEPPA